MLNPAIAAAIDTQKAELARLIVEKHWARNPGFQQLYRESGHTKCVADVTYNLGYLSQAISSNSPPLFSAYARWLQGLFEGLKIPTTELVESLTITDEILQHRFPEGSATIHEFIALGLASLAGVPAAIPSFFRDDQPLSGLARLYLDALRDGDRAWGSRMIHDAVTHGTPVKDVYLYVFQASQREIGRLWQTNQMSVGEEHFCTAATQMIMSELYPHIFGTQRNGRVLLAACVGSELHEIGLRMVADFFELDGWNTYYLGASTPAASIVQTLTQRKADVLAVSTTMTLHVSFVADLIRQVRRADASRRIKILAGGYPFNIDAELWRTVDADGSGAGRRRRRRDRE